ncbi:MAG TPA: phage holin family protein [Candidatus Bathyarchaeia archaeon]|nr:phage holin family protein [Candidatus Bathyarchaeia archaeon]
MSKDQAIGGAILVVCALVAIGYAVLVIFPAEVSKILGMTVDANTGTTVRLWAVLVPVFIAFVAILMIGAWIGWTMATTPPPKPIEEITSEMEEKKEEIKPEEPAAPASAPVASSAPEKKKKER